MFTFTANGQFIVRDNSLDFENIYTYVVVVTASEVNRRPALSTTQAIMINLIDVNENPYIADQTISVKEDVCFECAVGTKIAASDIDFGQTVVYDIVGGDKYRQFAFVLSQPGQIVAIKPLDYEFDNQHRLTVRVTDNGKGALTYDGEVTINIVDVNEAPVFPPGQKLGLNGMVYDDDEQLRKYTRTVHENDRFDLSSNGVDVVNGGGVKALDQDGAGSWASLTYAILGAKGVAALGPEGALASKDIPNECYDADAKCRFTVDADTAVLSTIAKMDLNAEVFQYWKIVLQVSDGEFTDVVTMTVHVLDINEVPVITTGQTRNIIDDYQKGDADLRWLDLILMLDMDVYYVGTLRKVMWVMPFKLMKLRVKSLY